MNVQRMKINMDTAKIVNAYLSKKSFSSKGTLDYYQRTLLRFLNFLETEQKSIGECDASTINIDFRNYLHDRLKLGNNTLRQIRVQLTDFVRYLNNEGYTSIKPEQIYFQDTEKDGWQEYISIRRRDVTDEEILGMIMIEDQDNISSLVDVCIVLILAETGAKTSEVVSLKVSDYNEKESTISIGKEKRVIKISNRLDQYLKQYMQDRHYPSEYLILSHRGSRVSYQANSRSIQRAVTRMGKRLGVKLYPQLLRHSLAKKMVFSGVPSVEVKKSLGYSSRRMFGRLTNVQNRDDLKRFYPNLVSVQSYAKLKKLSARTIYRMCKSQKLKYIVVKNKYFIDKNL